MSENPSSGSRLKRILARLTMALLVGLGLVIAVLLFYAGLTEGNLLQIAGGFLGAAAAGGLLVALVLPARWRTNRWVPVIGGLVLACGVALLVGVVTQVDAGAACRGEEVASAAVYEGGPGVHPVEAVYKGRRMWTAPSGWRPGSTEETELVACVGPLERYVLQTCPYIGGATVTRYSYRRTVTLVAARTGEVLASETFTGEPPRACGQTEERSERSLKGEKRIDPDEVWEWLSAWVAPEEGAAPTAEPAAPTRILIVTEPPVARPVEEVKPVATEAPVEEVEPVEQVLPEPVVTEADATEASPEAIVTPGHEPPETAVLIGSPSLWSGPDHLGEHMGIILDEGETVEILATTEEWTQVRWVSPEGEEVIGWSLSQWVGTP